MRNIVPDPGNALSGYKYLLQEAERGMFDKTSDLLVMMYLWTHAWRKADNPDGVPRGWVQADRSSVRSIVKGTMLDKVTVCRALGRLRDRGWIETEYIDGDPRRGQYIWVRVDPAGHQARHELYAEFIQGCMQNSYSEPGDASLICKDQLKPMRRTG